MFLSWEEGCKSCGCCFFGFVQFRSCKMGPSKTESLYNIVVFHPHHFSMARKDANTWEDTVPETDLRQKKKVNQNWNLAFKILLPIFLLHHFLGGESSKAWGRLGTFHLPSAKRGRNVSGDSAATNNSPPTRRRLERSCCTHCSRKRERLWFTWWSRWQVQTN